PPPPRWQLVIARRRTPALGASPSDALMRLQGNLDKVRVPSPTSKPNLLVNKPPVVLNAVQNRFSFELDGWSPFGGFACGANYRLTPSTETSDLPSNLLVSQPRSLRRRLVRGFFVVDFLTLPGQLTHKLCDRAISSCPPPQPMKVAPSKSTKLFCASRGTFTPLVTRGGRHQDFPESDDSRLWAEHDARTYLFPAAFDP
ncbi:MAG: hypothetical protein ACREP9_04720, partial [Candidatus Dormibacteraceae bacterium]